MNSDIFVGKWKQFKGRVWLMLAEMVDSDSVWLAGSNECLSGVLQEDYGREQYKVSSESSPMH